MMTSPQVSWLFFKGGPARNASGSDGGGATRISRLIRKERATQKNSQPAAARKVALKMGGVGVARRLQIDSDMRPLPPVRLGPPCRPPIFNATTSRLYVRGSTGSIHTMRSRPGETRDCTKDFLYQP